MNRSSATQDVIGKWPAVLSALGIDKRFLTNKHGPCPLCEGKDRFRFDDKDGRGTFYCAQCGAGDGWALLGKAKGWDFKQSLREVEPLLGSVQPIQIRSGPSEEAVRREMKAIWVRGLPLAQVVATTAWWLNRVGYIPDYKDLRAVNLLACSGYEHRPAMVAVVRGVEGKGVNLHRTYLTPDGQKADIDSARRVMPLPMPKGCAVRLGEFTTTLGIAEGLETAVAASLMFKMPVWSALNAHNLENWIAPEGPDIVIFGDNDPSFTGHSAAYKLASRLRREKRKVTVRIPLEESSDWNDVYLQQRGEGG